VVRWLGGMMVGWTDGWVGVLGGGDFEGVGMAMGWTGMGWNSIEMDWSWTGMG